MNTMEKEFQKIRKNILALNNQIYVNWGGAGPSPKRVIENINAFLE